MRALHVVWLDKPRPAVLLTCEVALPFLSGITVAPITSTVRGDGHRGAGRSGSRPGPGERHQLRHHHDGQRRDVLEQIGYLDDQDEQWLLEAVQAAFGLLPSPS